MRRMLILAVLEAVSTHRMNNGNRVINPSSTVLIICVNGSSPLPPVISDILKSIDPTYIEYNPAEWRLPLSNGGMLFRPEMNIQ